MARRQKPKPSIPSPKNQTPTPADLKERILADFAALRVPLGSDAFDAILARAQREGMSHQQFLHLLIGEQANQRRERSIAHRIREAQFAERKPLGEFDWEFNKQAIDRVQIEELATGSFIQRQDNLVIVGQSGVGKSFLAQAIAESAAVLGYTVRYTTSAALLIDLTKSLADSTLPKRVRYYARFDLLVIDEFGFDRIERTESPQAANLLYKIIDARSRQRSTALVTNIDFDAWGDYLGDPPLAMAFLDRIVDGAIIMKINGKSYRAHRARQPKSKPASKG
jgi:DNA replication protein DnaC